MAKQTKHLVGLSDVKAVVLECKHCESSVSFALARNRAVPASCPVCGGDWDRTHSPTGFNAIVGDFITRQRRLQDAFAGPVASSVGYTVRLEVDIKEHPAHSE